MISVPTRAYPITDDTGHSAGAIVKAASKGIDFARGSAHHTRLPTASGSGMLKLDGPRGRDGTSTRLCTTQDRAPGKEGQ